MPNYSVQIIDEDTNAIIFSQKYKDTASGKGLYAGGPLKTADHRYQVTCNLSFVTEKSEAEKVANLITRKVAELEGLGVTVDAAMRAKIESDFAAKAVKKNGPVTVSRS